MGLALQKSHASIRVTPNYRSLVVMMRYIAPRSSRRPACSNRTTHGRYVSVFARNPCGISPEQAPDRSVAASRLLCSQVSKGSCETASELDECTGKVTPPPPPQLLDVSTPLCVYTIYVPYQSLDVSTPLCVSTIYVCTPCASQATSQGHSSAQAMQLGE